MFTVESFDFAVFLNFLKDFIYLFFRERKKEGKGEGEKQRSVASLKSPTGDLAHSPVCALTGK